MVRKVRSAKMDSRTARTKLAAAAEPYYVSCGPALALGYRKTLKGTSWSARGFDGRRYHKTVIGMPDDAIDADGLKILTFHQATASALAWWAFKQGELSGKAPKAGPVTVRQAAADYVTAYQRRGGKDLGSVESRLNLHLLPTFGEVEITTITKPQIEKWLHAMAAMPRLLKASKLGLRKQGELDTNDIDAVRRRRSAANRTLTVLKAILNHAFAAHDTIASDKAWRTVKPFPAVDAARERFLSEDEAARLINGATGPFRDLALAALLTGCRYGELAALTVGNVNLANGTIYIATSKSGHPRHVVLTEPGIKLFKVLTNSRKTKENVFMRTLESPWRSCDQLRPMKQLCKVAGIEPPVGFHALRHTYASHLVSQGTGLQVVATQIGHRSTTMTEKHYAHLQPSYVADQIRANLPSLGAPDSIHK